jgi:hypothetical protein
MKLKGLLASFLFVSSTFALIAQEEASKEGRLSVGMDLATSYLWRGFEFGNAPAFQPWGEYSYKGFALGAWGSYEWTGNYKEVDLYAKYTAGDFTVSLTDLFFPGCVGLDQNFFNFKNRTTGHTAELGLAFNGNDQVPFSLFGGLLLYGAPVDPSAGDTTKVNHSMYVEANYNGTFKDVSYHVFVGLTPTESPFYQTQGFGICNVGVSAQKSLPVSNSFSLPVKLTLSANPTLKQVFMAFVVSL